MSTPYLNFDIQIVAEQDGYKTQVLNSPAGQALADFALPFSDAILEKFIQQILAPSNAWNRASTDGFLQDFGETLFNALFQGEVQICLRRSIDRAYIQGARLRINLRLTRAPALANLPWEYLYRTNVSRFFTLAAETSLVHFLDLPDPIFSVKVTPPLHILVAISNPPGVPPLEVAQEWANIQHALQPLLAEKLVTIDLLESPTLASLQMTLRKKDYHVFHFIGHGLFENRTQEGMLVFHNEVDPSQPEPAARLVRAQDLGKLLHNEQSLRLVVLNACEGSRTSLLDPFAGTAQTLVQQGIPAVVAMQFPITDRAAITFSQDFYAALADGYGVDAAMTEARVAIATRLSGGEWGTPKLFMRIEDGLLWKLEKPTGSIQQLLRTQAEADLSHVDRDMNVLVSLSQMPKIRMAMVTFRSDFQAANEQIHILSDFKDLHDLLHSLQFRCYNVLVQEARRFPHDEWALDNLLNYEVTLQNIVESLLEVVARATINSSEFNWVDDLVEAQKRLGEAIDKEDAKPLRRTVWLLKRILVLQPSYINQRLNTAARALRLATIKEALDAIRGAVTHVNLGDEKVRDFDGVIGNLEALNHNLTLLVTEHDQWQAIDRMLRRVEDMMAYDLMELEMSWPDLQEMVAQISDGNDEEWAVQLHADSQKLNAAIDTHNPTRIRQYFQRYRQRTGNRFFQVDTELKHLCEGLRKIGEPLTAILKVLE